MTGLKTTIPRQNARYGPGARSQRRIGSIKHEEEGRRQRNQDGVILAQHRPAPGQAHPDPGREPPAVRLFEGDREPVEGQKPEEEQGPSGSAKVAAARP